MNSRKFITWQPVLTDHQAFTYESLAKISSSTLIAYVSEMEDAERRRQGWKDTRVSSILRVKLPKFNYLRTCYIALKQNRNNIHIFASPFQEWRLILCLFMARLLAVEIYLISEPYSNISEGYFSKTLLIKDRLKSLIRPLIYRLYMLFLRNHVSGIFAISPLAKLQYIKAGVNPNKIYRFGYFIPKDSVDQMNLKVDCFESSKILNIIFIGSLIRRKGLDILLEATYRIIAQGYKVSLDVYGPGDISQYHIDDAVVRYKGIIPFGEAQRVIRNYHLLVLPSRFDGWGVVVNEAICAGVPVITSDSVGAGLTISELGAGICFKSGDVLDLFLLLRQVVENPMIINSLAIKAKEAYVLLQPEKAAQYMFEIITGRKTVPTLL